MNNFDSDIMDIVTMLRAADRLEPHLCAAAANEIERLRKERDEARREVCGLLVACHTDPDDDDKPDPNLKHIHAGIRGWDCFKEDKEDTDD